MADPQLYHSLHSCAVRAGKHKKYNISAHHSSLHPSHMMQDSDEETSSEDDVDEPLDFSLKSSHLNASTAYTNEVLQPLDYSCRNQATADEELRDFTFPPEDLLFDEHPQDYTPEYSQVTSKADRIPGRGGEQPLAAEGFARRPERDDSDGDSQADEPPSGQSELICRQCKDTNTQHLFITVICGHVRCRRCVCRWSRCPCAAEEEGYTSEEARDEPESPPRISLKREPVELSSDETVDTDVDPREEDIDDHTRTASDSDAASASVGEEARPGPALNIKEEGEESPCLFDAPPGADSDAEAGTDAVAASPVAEETPENGDADVKPAIAPPPSFASVAVGTESVATADVGTDAVAAAAASSVTVETPQSWDVDVKPVVAPPSVVSVGVGTESVARAEVGIGTVAALTFGRGVPADVDVYVKPAISSTLVDVGVGTDFVITPDVCPDAPTATNSSLDVRADTAICDSANLNTVGDTTIIANQTCKHCRAKLSADGTPAAGNAVEKVDVGVCTTHSIVTMDTSVDGSPFTLFVTNIDDSPEDVPTRASHALVVDVKDITVSTSDVGVDTGDLPGRTLGMSAMAASTVAGSAVLRTHVSVDTQDLRAATKAALTVDAAVGNDTAPNCADVATDTGVTKCDASADTRGLVATFTVSTAAGSDAATGCVDASTNTKIAQSDVNVDTQDFIATFTVSTSSCTDPRPDCVDVATNTKVIQSDAYVDTKDFLAMFTMEMSTCTDAPPGRVDATTDTEIVQSDANVDTQDFVAMFTVSSATCTNPPPESVDVAINTRVAQSDVNVDTQDFTAMRTACRSTCTNPLPDSVDAATNTKILQSDVNVDTKDFVAMFTVSTGMCTSPLPDSVDVATDATVTQSHATVDTRDFLARTTVDSAAGSDTLPNCVDAATLTEVMQSDVIVDTRDLVSRTTADATTGNRAVHECVDAATNTAVAPKSVQPDVCIDSEVVDEATVRLASGVHGSSNTRSSPRVDSDYSDTAGKTFVSQNSVQHLTNSAESFAAGFGVDDRVSAVPQMTSHPQGASPLSADLNRESTLTETIACALLSLEDTPCEELQTDVSRSEEFAGLPLLPDVADISQVTREEEVHTEEHINAADTPGAENRNTGPHFTELPCESSTLLKLLAEVARSVETSAEEVTRVEMSDSEKVAPASEAFSLENPNEEVSQVGNVNLDTSTVEKRPCVEKTGTASVDRPQRRVSRAEKPNAERSNSENSQRKISTVEKSVAEMHHLGKAVRKKSNMRSPAKTSLIGLLLGDTEDAEVTTAKTSYAAFTAGESNAALSHHDQNRSEVVPCLVSQDLSNTESSIGKTNSANCTTGVDDQVSNDNQGCSEVVSGVETSLDTGDGAISTGESRKRDREHVKMSSGCTLTPTTRPSLLNEKAIPSEDGDSDDGIGGGGDSNDDEQLTPGNGNTDSATTASSKDNAKSRTSSSSLDKAKSSGSRKRKGEYIDNNIKRARIALTDGHGGNDTDDQTEGESGPSDHVTRSRNRNPLTITKDMAHDRTERHKLALVRAFLLVHYKSSSDGNNQVRLSQMMAEFEKYCENHGFKGCTCVDSDDITYAAQTTFKDCDYCGQRKLFTGIEKASPASVLSLFKPGTALVVEDFETAAVDFLARNYEPCAGSLLSAGFITQHFMRELRAKDLELIPPLQSTSYLHRQFGLNQCSVAFANCRYDVSLAMVHGLRMRQDGVAEFRDVGGGRQKTAKNPRKRTKTAAAGDGRRRQAAKPRIAETAVNHIERCKDGRIVISKGKVYEVLFRSFIMVNYEATDSAEDQVDLVYVENSFKRECDKQGRHRFPLAILHKLRIMGIIKTKFPTCVYDQGSFAKLKKVPVCDIMAKVNKSKQNVLDFLAVVTFFISRLLLGSLQNFVLATDLVATFREYCEVHHYEIPGPYHEDVVLKTISGQICTSLFRNCFFDDKLFIVYGVCKKSNNVRTLDEGVGDFYPVS